MFPQHLQQADQYHENLIAARVGALAPYDWGVHSIEIDSRALSTGQLRIAQLTAILPDGLPLSFDGDDPEAPPARPIEGYFAPTQRALEVYIGVPREREGISSYLEPGATSAARPRFTISTRNVSDATGAAGEVQVPFGQRNTVVLFGIEPRDDFEAIKVAEVVRDNAGALVVCDPYIPPCTRIAASTFIMASLRRLLALMVAKQRVLAETRRQRDASSVEFSSGDITRYLVLNAVNTYIPLVSHLIDLPDVNPHLAYLVLSQTAGALSAFAVDTDPSTLPKYEYNNLRATFEELFARIMALLQQAIREQYITVPLDPREDGMYLGRLEDDRLLRCTNYVLTVRSEVPEPQVVDRVPKISKIASWGDISAIVQSATPGVPLQVTYRPPPEIPVRAGLVYFQLIIGDQYWRNVLQERTLAIYLPPPFDLRSTKLELLAVPPSGR